MAVLKKTIAPEHKLPCDFIVGHIRYRKGVKLETVRAAAERWYKTAVITSTEHASHPTPAELTMQAIYHGDVDGDGSLA